jgi:hypothetical protein
MAVPHHRNHSLVLLEWRGASLEPGEIFGEVPLTATGGFSDWIPTLGRCGVIQPE